MLCKLWKRDSGEWCILKYLVVGCNLLECLSGDESKLFFHVSLVYLGPWKRRFFHKMELYYCLQFWDRCCMLSCCSHWKANINIATAVLNAVTNLRSSILFKILGSQACYLPLKEHVLQFNFSNLQGVAKCTWQMDCYLQYWEQYCGKILIVFSAPLVHKVAKCLCTHFVCIFPLLYTGMRVALWGEKNPPWKIFLFCFILFNRCFL